MLQSSTRRGSVLFEDGNQHVRAQAAEGEVGKSSLMPTSRLAGWLESLEARLTVTL